METFIDGAGLITALLLVIGPRRKAVTALAFALTVTFLHNLYDGHMAATGYTEPEIVHNATLAALSLVWARTVLYYYNATKIDGRQLSDTDFF